MPTYEYICEACEYEFEKFQSITAEPITDCPECRKKKVRRKISTGAGILFKGGGFYETDYRSPSYNEAKKKDTEAASSSKSETKSDSSAKSESSSKPAAEKKSSGDKGSKSAKST